MDVLNEYYLLEKGDRLIIDTKAKRGYKKVGKVVASSWVDAKSKFGYKLTDIQAFIARGGKYVP